MCDLQVALTYFCNSGLVMMLKAWPLCTRAESNLGDRTVGEVDKVLLPCQAKWDIADSCLQKLCVPNAGEFDEEFYSKGSSIGVLIRLECVLGLHFFKSGGLSPKYDEILWSL